MSYIKRSREPCLSCGFWEGDYEQCTAPSYMENWRPCDEDTVDNVLITLEYGGFHNHGRIVFNLQEILYPDPWWGEKSDKKQLTENPISQIRKILKMIKQYGDPEDLIETENFIIAHGKKRRTEKYLEIWRSIK